MSLRITLFNLFLCISVFLGHVYAQPCSSIINISCGTTIPFISVSGDGDVSFPNGVGTSNYYYSGKGGTEKIYKFVAPTDGLYQISTTTSTSNSSYLEYYWMYANSGCSSYGWNALGISASAGALNSLALSANDSIFILVNSESTTSVSQSFLINCALPFPCNNISTISCGTVNKFSVASGFGHPDFKNGVNTSCYYNSGKGGLEKIYKFIAPSSGLYQINTTSTTNNGSYVDYLYTDAINGCSSYYWTCLGTTASATPLNSIKLETGDSIFILANAEGIAGVTQTFQINCAVPFPCNNISTINCGSTISFNVGSGYGNPDFPNGVNTSCYYNTGKGGLEKIYKFIAPSTGLYQINTTSSTNNGSYVEYFYTNAINGCSSNNWTCLGTTASANPLSSVTLDAGDSILILANAEGLSGVSQSFQINCAVAYPCSSIITINCGSSITFSVGAGYGNPNFPNGVYTSCVYNSGKGGLEKIYKFIAPSTGLYQFGTTSNTNNGSYVEYLYTDAANGCGNSNWTCLGTTASAYPLSSFVLNAGDSILILANAEGISGVSQSFQLSCAIPFPCNSMTTINCGSNVNLNLGTGYGHPSYQNGVGTSCYYNSGKGGLEKMYKFIAPTNGLYQFATTSGTNNGSYIGYYYANANNICNNSTWNCLGTTAVAGPLNSFSLNAGDSIVILANAEGISGVTQSLQISCATQFPCDNITNLTCGSNTNFVTTVGYGLSSYQNGVGTGCVYNSGKGGLEKIYRFVAPLLGYYRLETITSSTNSVNIEYFYKKSNDCSGTGWSCFGYVNTAKKLDSILLKYNDTVLILVNSESPTATSQTFRLNCATTVCNIAPVTKNTTLSGCGSVTYNSKTYTNNTIVKDTLKNIYGCDSIYNAVTIAVTSIVTPTISITASQTSFTPGTQVRIDATVTNEGTSPIYHWKRNGTDIIAGNSLAFPNLANDDSVWCVLTSNISCVSAANAISNKLIFKTINAIPSITSVNPLKAKVGDTVSIKGLNFRDTVINRTIYFGAVKGKIVTTSDTLIKVIVPEGASYSPISIYIDGLSATSLLPFSTLFSAAKSFQPYSFEPPIDSIYGNDISAIASSDFDGDGKIDFVEFGNTSIYCNRNISTPKKIAFAAKQKLLDWGAAKLTMNNLIIEDLDGDGKKDIVFAVLGTQYTSSSIYYLKNKSTVSQILFDTAVYITGYFGSQNSFAVGDIDLDGRLDIAINRKGYVDILRNTTTNGNISFQTVQYVISPPGYPLNQIKMADMNGDGKLDLVILDTDTWNTKVYINYCNIGEVNKFYLTESKSNSNYLTIGDYNSDNKIDVATVSGGGLIALKNIGTNPNSLAFDTTQFVSGINSSAIETTDFNGDGYPDLAISGYYNGYIAGVSLMANQPKTNTISFNSPQSYLSDSSISTNVPITVADFDGDGIPDIAIGNSNKKTTGKVSFFRNRINTISITYFNPTIGTVGTTVTIKGYQFSEVTAVTFGGVPAASFTVVNDTTITAIVGNGGTGTVALTSPYGTVANNGFIFCATPVSKNLDLNGCNSVVYKGVIYTNNTSFKDTLKNGNGCDSIYYTINIAINKITPITKSSTLTGCTSVSFNGKVYTNNTVLKDTLKSYQGCDSVYVVTNIKVNNLTVKTVAKNVTGCYSVVYNGTIYLNSTSMTDTIRSVQGCDSLYNVTNIVVATPVIPTVSIEASATTINQGDTVKLICKVNEGVIPTYQWYKNATPILGATDSMYSTTTLNDKDYVYVLITSHAPCFSNATASSNLINFTVIPVNIWISGTVKNPNGVVIPSVTLSLNRTNSKTTDAFGGYKYDVAPNNNYTITPSKSNDVLVANGINGTDISLIQSHILKKVVFNSPYKLIAGDVNSDGSVNGTDIALIKSLILKKITKFSGNRLWAFVDSNYTFPVPTKPFPYRDSITLTGQKVNSNTNSFIGVKLGDVNYDWNASVLGNPANYNSPIELYNDDIIVNQSDNEVRIPVRIKNFKQIMGIQFTLNFNKNAFALKAIENNKIGADYNLDFIEEGKIPFLWVDASSEPKTLADSTLLFELVFNKKGNFNSEEIKLSDDITSINAFDGNYAAVRVVQSKGSFTQKSISNDAMTIYPNPAKDKLTIKGQHINKIEVIDNSGRIIKSLQVKDATNPNLIVDKLGSGLYRVRIQSVDGKISSLSFVKE